MKESALLLGTLFEQPSLFVRLKEELTEASRQFRQDPRAYVTAALRNDAAGGSRRKMLLQFGLAAGIVFYAAAFAAILVFWTVSNRASTHAPEITKPPDLIFPGRPIVEVQGPNDKDPAGGGGGGGNGTELPASAGQPPPSSLQDSLMAPSPEPPVKEPALPMMEIVKVDPRINLRTDDLAPTGLVDGVVGPPEAGSGDGHGMGTGKGGGLGSGKGRGFGPGQRENIGNGSPHIGGFGASSTSDQDERVDTRPVPLNRPRPNYTEAARQHKIQGVIRARVLIGADGSISRVVIVRPLPDGLNEEAIAAVYQMHFRAATRSGQFVASWITLEVEFNLR